MKLDWGPVDHLTWDQQLNVSFEPLDINNILRGKNYYK